MVSQREELRRRLGFRLVSLSNLSSYAIRKLMVGDREAGREGIVCMCTLVSTTKGVLDLSFDAYECVSSFPFVYLIRDGGILTLKRSRRSWVLEERSTVSIRVEQASATPLQCVFVRDKEVRRVCGSPSSSLAFSSTFSRISEPRLLSSKPSKSLTTSSTRLVTPVTG